MINLKPSGGKVAVCFTIDDMHLGKSTDCYKVGGDLEQGRFGLVKCLLDRNPRLKVTLITTENWRDISLVPIRKLLSSILELRDQFYLSKMLKKGTLNLERHSEFVNFLNNWDSAEIAFHGLYQVHKGLKIPFEFEIQFKF